MTTKLKTRKAPAAKPATREKPLSSPYDHTTTNVHNLIARWYWLEADCRYHAVFCPPAGEKGGVFNVRHRNERDEIMQRLAKTIPECFDDSLELLDFATKRLKVFKALSRIGSEPVIIDMLKNARVGIFAAQVKMRMDFTPRSFNEMNQLGDAA